MHFLNNSHPRLILSARITMWAAIGLFVMVGLFRSVPAWAEPAACPGQSSIPITPLALFLRYGGPPSTYQVSLCEDPDAPVNIAASPSQAGKVTISPANFALTSTLPLTVSVSVANGHPADEPFTVIISHTATSADPDFDYGSLNVPRVTAYYSPPVAVDDSADTLHGQSVTITVRANDVDRLGGGLTVPANATFTPSSGTATLSANQTILYTPTVGFSGVATFTYPIVDAIGNSDTGLVTVTVASANVTNYTVEEIDPQQGGTILLATDFGTAEVEIPNLVGVAPGSDVRCLVGEVENPTGDETSPPDEAGTYTGIALEIQCYVNGELVTPAMLAEPITVSIALPEGLAEALDGTRLEVAYWDGTTWVTEGIVVDKLTGAVLRFTTTRFGEFVVFVVYDIFMPLLGRE